MSNKLEFHCPVCRAKQPLQETCRRCKADLGLVVRVRRRVEYLISEIEQAEVSGDQEREELLAAELQWLVPQRP